MTDALLILILLFAGIFGCRIMDRVDRFLDACAKGEEEETDEQRQR